MRYKLIVCKVLQKESYFCAARSRNTVDIHLMPQGLHNEPDKLRTWLVEAVKGVCDIQDRPYDALLLGYGLCSNGIVGVSASIPVVVPRGHDCITLLLGSRKRYQDYFDSHRGVYWYSPGWIDDGKQPSKERFEATLREYTEKYGADNAAYLMEMQEGWMKEYSWATYVDWGLPGMEEYKQYTRRCAEFLKWNYDEIAGDPGLFQRMLDGQWNSDEFLVVNPGQAIAQDLTNPGIICCKDCPR